MATHIPISRKQLLARLGLPDDASDEQLEASLNSPANEQHPAADSVATNAEQTKALAEAAEDELMRKAGW